MHIGRFAASVAKALIWAHGPMKAFACLKKHHPIKKILAIPSGSNSA